MIKNPHIFIVSSGRSGSTLLVSMLNASQQIFCPYESDFIARSFPLYAEKKLLSTDEYRHLIELFFLCSQPKGWGLSKKTLFDALDQYQPKSLAEVFSVFCQVFHESNDTQDLLWGVKCPVLIASLPEIIQLYPESKIVHIVRDGRDVYLSYKAIHEKSEVKFGPKGVLQSALYWIDGLRRVERFRHRDQLLELKYESLLQNPEVELKQLSKFMAIDYTPDMHENFNRYEKNQALTPSKLNSDVHAKLGKKLDSTNIEKFREKMSHFEKFIFELIAGPYIGKYGYYQAYPILQLFLFKPIQYSLYFLSRVFNSWRYSKRDRETIEKAFQLMKNQEYRHKTH